MNNLNNSSLNFKNSIFSCATDTSSTISLFQYLKGLSLIFLKTIFFIFIASVLLVISAFLDVDSQFSKDFLINIYYNHGVNLPDYVFFYILLVMIPVYFFTQWTHLNKLVSIKSKIKLIFLNVGNCLMISALMLNFFNNFICSDIVYLVVYVFIVFSLIIILITSK